MASEACEVTVIAATTGKMGVLLVAGLDNARTWYMVGGRGDPIAR